MGIDSVIPVTYINSSAAIKAFVGEHGGIVCTSGNASAVLKWAWAARRAHPVPARPAPRPQHRLQDGRAARPDGRVGSARARRRPHARAGPRGAAAAVEGPLLGPHALHGAADRARARAASRRPRDRAPGSAVGRRAGRRRQRLDRAHPQDRCARAPPGSVWAVGTEVHLVNRLANEVAPDKTVLSLDQLGCLCSTMFRVSPNHLLWVLEELLEGRVQNRSSSPTSRSTGCASRSTACCRPSRYSDPGPRSRLIGLARLIESRLASSLSLRIASDYDRQVIRSTKETPDGPSTAAAAL